MSMYVVDGILLLKEHVVFSFNWCLSRSIVCFKVVPVVVVLLEEKDAVFSAGVG